MLYITPEALRLLRGTAASSLVSRRAQITLAGPKSAAKEARKPKLSGGRYDRLVAAAVTLLSSRESSKFQYEGACRAGIRCALCLDGWRWPHADAMAGEITAKALDRIGAVRPTWAEGQPEHEESLTLRTRCMNSGCGRPIPEERFQTGNAKYCCRECAVSHIGRAKRQSGEQVSRAEWLASMAAHSQRRFIENIGHCEQCEATFVPQYAAQRFCSYSCRDQAATVHHPQPCEVCGTIYKPKSSKDKFGKAVPTRTCSHECRVQLTRKPRTEVTCKGCSTVFTVKRSWDVRSYCSRQCASQANHATRRAAIQCEAVS